MIRTVSHFHNIYYIVSIFSEEEKANLKKEFFYKNQGKQTKGDISIETEWFNEQSLEASQNELTKNVSSKSNVLAPFNSTYSELLEEEKIIESLPLNKNIIKLSPKVKDIDRQYEKDNNCDLDNGVYNKLLGISSDNTIQEINPFSSNEEQKDDINEILEEDKEKGRLSPTTFHKYVNPETEAAQVYLLNSMIKQRLIIGKSIFFICL